MRISGILAGCTALMLWSSSAPAQDSGACKDALAQIVAAPEGEGVSYVLFAYKTVRPGKVHGIARFPV
jgi:hypothetical protein